MSLAHPLRASVMRADEWFKDRDQAAWVQIKKQALQRDQYTCSYCLLICQKFMQVNHIGAEDRHDLENLETVCGACHRVLHLGASALDGLLTVFECKPDLTDMAVIVRMTRALVYRQTPWPQIEQHILDRFALPGGRHYSASESVSTIVTIERDGATGWVKATRTTGEVVLIQPRDALALMTWSQGITQTLIARSKGMLTVGVGWGFRPSHSRTELVLLQWERIAYHTPSHQQ